MASTGCCGQLLRPLIRRKKLDDARSMETPLRRCLSTWQVMFGGISYTLGAGIFILIGTVIHTKAGPAGFISFLICSIICLITSFSFIEFATLVPRAGSSYLYTYLTLGELPAFIVGWTVVSDFIVTIPASAKSMSATINSITNNAVLNYTIAHFGPLPKSDYLAPSYDFLAVFVLTLLAAVNLIGARVSMTMNLVLSIFQCIVISFIIVSCFVYGSTDNLVQQPGGFMPFGVFGIFRATSIAFFAVCGFETILNAAEECENPSKTMPRAVFGTIAIVTLLHVLASIGLSYLTPYFLIDINSPFLEAFKLSRGHWVIYIVAVGVFVSTGLSKLTGLFSLSRFIYALASDGLIFSCFGYVNETVKVPVVGLLVGWLLTSLLSLLVNLETLANLVSMATLLNYMIVGVDVYYLRFLYFRDTEVSVSEQTTIVHSDLCQLRPWATPLLSHFAFARRRSFVKVCLLLFVVSSALTGLAINYVLPQLTWWAWLLTCAAAALSLKLGLVLCCYEPWRIGGVYESPLIPVTSLLTIFLNCLVLMTLQPLTWLRFLAWSLIGLLMYFLYGCRHSAAAKQSLGDYVLMDDDAKQQQQQQKEQQQQQQLDMKQPQSYDERSPLQVSQRKSDH